MSIEIPNSAVAVVNIDISTPGGNTADSQLAAIAQELLFDGLTIASKSVGITGLTYPLTGEFTAQIQILNQSGQELDDTDLTSQFNDACNQLGFQVNSFAILQVIGGSSGVNSGTGTQGNVVTTGAGVAANSGPGTAGNPPACGDPALTLWTYPQQWFSCLTSKGLSTIGLLAIGLLIGVILIVGMQRRPTPV